MLTMTYPVNGDTSKNVKVTVLPEWTTALFGKYFVAFAAFRRLWVSGHLKPLVAVSTDLARFDSFLAWSYEHLCQQQRFPIGGIGWWIERRASLHTKLEQDLPAYASYLRSYPERARSNMLLGLWGDGKQFASIIPQSEFVNRIAELAKHAPETGGM